MGQMLTGSFWQKIGDLALGEVCVGEWKVDEGGEKGKVREEKEGGCEGGGEVWKGRERRRGGGGGGGGGLVKRMESRGGGEEEGDAAAPSEGHVPAEGGGGYC